MFKTRSAGQGGTSPASPPSVEAVRRRARHRLIGASVLVLAGVIGFPILFDTQPRPIAVDLPIDIPGRQSTKPLAIPPAVVQAPAEAPAPAKARPADITETASGAPVAEQPVPKAPAPVPDKPAEKLEPKAAEKAVDPNPAKAQDKTPAKVAEKPVDKPAAKAVADTPASKSAEKAAGRLVVQVGAFAEADRARDVRQKLERAGLKTYTHVTETPQGKRIRVRVGPFDTKAEADKVAQKVKALGLPAAVLTL